MILVASVLVLCITSSSSCPLTRMRLPFHTPNLPRLKSRFFKSGARLLFFGFLMPLLALVCRALILMATLPRGGTRVVKAVKIGAPAPPLAPLAWNLDCVAAMSVEIISMLGSAAVLVGATMLSREPLNITKKLSPWVRGCVLIVSGVWALVGFSKCICWFLRNNTYYKPLLMLELGGRWAPILASLWLVRSISVLRCSPYIRQLATASIFISCVVQVMGAIANAVTSTSFFLLLFGMPQVLLWFGTIWAAQKLETPYSDLHQPTKPAKSKQRTPLRYQDKPV